MSDAEPVNIEINGQRLQADPQAMLIEVADAAGIAIPRFCYHEKLSIAANCRMCLVEVDQSAKPLPACATPVREGMKVWTQSAQTRHSQQAVMEFLLINHPLDCPICDQGGECELQDVAMAYGSGESHYQDIKRSVPDQDIGPLIDTAMTRCIHCTRCVRFGDEVAGLRELGAFGRGEHLEIGTYIEKALLSELSGNVIDLCPVGALTAKPSRYQARAWEMRAHASISPHDAVGANIEAHSFDGRIMRVVPRANEAVNECWIADRERFSYAGLYAEDRLEQPQVKVNGEWQTLSWPEALQKVATLLRHAPPEQLGALVAPTATAEEHFLLQKLIRGLGGRHIDHRLRQSDFRLDDYEPVTPCLGMSLADLEQQQAVLLLGAWPRHEQPLLNYRLRKAALAGARMMAVNPWQADFNYAVEQHAVAPAKLVERCARLARAACERANKALPEAVAALCEDVSVTAEDEAFITTLREAERATVMLGHLAQQHPDYSCLVALAEVIAAHTGAHWTQLPNANALGATWAGALPHRGLGGEWLTSAASGLAVNDMLNGAARHFVLLQAEVEDFASPRQALDAFAAATDVIAITSFASELTRKHATVLLPCSTFLETAGTFVNATGAWQSFKGAAVPPAEARPAWKILRVLGNQLKLPAFDYLSCEEIAAELKLEVQLIKADAAAMPSVETTPPKLSQSLNLPPDTTSMQRIGDVHIYRSDALVRRAEPLQALVEPLTAYLHPQDVERLELQAEDLIAFEQEGTRIQLPFACDEFIPVGCVRIQAGFAASNTLGSAFGLLAAEKA